MAKTKETLKPFHVYSSIEDKDIEKNLNDSPIWQQCYHKEDLPEGFSGFEYKIAFDGLKPVQVMDVKRY